MQDTEETTEPIQEETEEDQELSEITLPKDYDIGKPHTGKTPRTQKQLDALAKAREKANAVRKEKAALKVKELEIQKALEAKHRKDEEEHEEDTSSQFLAYQKAKQRRIFWLLFLLVIPTHLLLLFALEIFGNLFFIPSL